MPRGYESTDSDSNRDSYFSNSADTKEDYEKKDKAKVADPSPQGSIFFPKNQVISKTRDLSSF